MPFPPIQRSASARARKEQQKWREIKGAEALMAVAAERWQQQQIKRQWRWCTGCCVEGGWGSKVLFDRHKPTWHLQLSLRGPWLLRLIRLPERTIGVRCRTLVWMQPSFSNWIRSLSGSHGLVLGRETRKQNTLIMTNSLNSHCCCKTWPLDGDLLHWPFQRLESNWKATGKSFKPKYHLLEPVARWKYWN